MFCGVCHRRNSGASDFCICRESLIGYRPLNSKQVASWVTGQIRERDAAGVPSDADHIEVLRSWAGCGQPLGRIRDRGDARTRPLFRFLTLIRRAAVIAMVAFLVGLPGCAQIDCSMGPGGGCEPIPAWAVSLSLVALVGFLGLMILIPVMIVTRLAIYIYAPVRAMRTRAAKPRGSMLTARTSPGHTRKVKPQNGLATSLASPPHRRQRFGAVRSLEPWQFSWWELA